MLAILMRTAATFFQATHTNIHLTDFTLATFALFATAARSIVTSFARFTNLVARSTIVTEAYSVARYIDFQPIYPTFGTTTSTIDTHLTQSTRNGTERRQIRFTPSMNALCSRWTRWIARITVLLRVPLARCIRPGAFSINAFLIVITRRIALQRIGLRSLSQTHACGRVTLLAILSAGIICERTRPSNSITIHDDLHLQIGGSGYHSDGTVQ